MPSNPVVEVQRLFPRIYLACHADHVRAASTKFRISAHDSLLLSHLNEGEGVSPGKLARHLGVGAPTLSASIKRLVALGYVNRTPKPGNRRIVALRLTPHGSEAMTATSVLDRAHVAGMLAHLSASQRRRALAGLALLAGAATNYRKAHPSRRNLSP